MRWSMSSATLTTMRSPVPPRNWVTEKGMGKSSLKAKEMGKSLEMEMEMERY